MYNKRMTDFTGAKAALLYKEEILVYQRDNKPGLRFAGKWDFFGGGREGSETPFECLVREIEEELKIVIRENQVVFSVIFPAMHDPSVDAYFMVVQLTDDNAAQYQFGSEGQRCKFIGINQFLADDTFIPDLKSRMMSYLKSQSNK